MHPFLWARRVRLCPPAVPFRHSSDTMARSKEYRHEQAVELFRRGATPRMVASATGYTERHARRILRDLDPETRARVSAVTLHQKRGAVPLRRRLKARMLEDGLSPAEAAEAEGASARYARQVAADSAIGSTYRRAKAHARARELLLARSQECRDLRKGSLEPYLFSLIWEMRQLLPPSVWEELRCGRSVRATFAGDYIDAVDERAELVLGDGADVVAHAIECCEAVEDDPAHRPYTGDPVERLGRVWRGRVYGEGDREAVLGLKPDDVTREITLDELDAAVTEGRR